MITFAIKTWRCATCNYAQDFEPTKDNMQHNFNDDKKFRVQDVKANECPNCRLQGVASGIKSLKQETNLSKKIVFNCCEQSDVDALKLNLEAEPTRKIKTGRKLFQQVQPNEFVQVDEERDEISQERRKRIDDEIAQLKVITSQKLQELRAQFED